MTASRSRATLWGLRMPRPLPMGEPRGMTAAQPTCSSRTASTGSSLVYGEHDEAVVGQLLGRGQQLDGIGQQGPVVADDLELDPLGLEGLPGQLGREHRLAGGEAAGRVGQYPDAVPGPGGRAASPGPPGRSDAGPRWPWPCPRPPAPAPTHQAGHPPRTEQQPRAEHHAGDDQRIDLDLHTDNATNGGRRPTDATQVAGRPLRPGGWSASGRYSADMRLPALRPGGPAARPQAGERSGRRPFHRRLGLGRGRRYPGRPQDLRGPGVFGTTAITALTAQNTVAVLDVMR